VQRLGMLDSIKVILFDAAGTLFDVHGSVGEIYGRVARKYGIDGDPAALEAAFSNACRAKNAEGFSAHHGGDVRTERLWWMDVVRAVFGARMPEGLLERYFEEVFDTFRRAESWDLFPDTVPGLERLRSNGDRLGVLSNFDSRLFELLANLGLDRYFERVTISWRAGAAKPDRRIFERALDAMSAKPGEAVHVGDSIVDDYEGARQAGLGAVLLDRRRRHLHQEGIVRVESLLELNNMLAPLISGSRPA
jgi:putative hydrolase of the HAD superfamily